MSFRYRSSSPDTADAIQGYEWQEFLVTRPHRNEDCLQSSRLSSQSIWPAESWRSFDSYLRTGTSA
jgi:hypothetical protein